MLRPETDFIGQPDKDITTLTKIFRRYSRCDDFIVSPLDHAKRMSDRICEKLRRHSDNPEMTKRVARRLWPVGQLAYELRHGCPQEDIDIGLVDRSAVGSTFTKIREDLISKACANEPALKRA